MKLLSSAEPDLVCIKEKISGKGEPYWSKCGTSERYEI